MDKAIERAARHHLYESIVLFKKAGMTEWQFIKMTMKIWEDPGKEFSKFIEGTK